MLPILSLVALLLAAPQPPEAERAKRPAVGTRAEARTEGLPSPIVERMRAIEAKKRPSARSWKGSEAEELMRRPGFEKARQASIEMATRHHERLARRMRLAGEERRRFLSILGAAHEARLEAVAFMLEQGSGYPRRLREAAEAEKLPDALRQADPRRAQRKLRELLGEKRFAHYVELSEAGSER